MVYDTRIMRILMYAPIYPPAIGGPSTQCWNLCRALHARGEAPIVVTPGERFEKQSPDGFPVYRYPNTYTHTPLDKAFRWIVFPFYFSWILFKEKPEIVHCHSASVASFMAGFIARIVGIPRVLKFAGDWVWETLSTRELTEAKDFTEIYTSSATARIMTWIERRGVNLFDIIWTPSEFRRSNIRYLIGTDEKTRIIPNCLLLTGGGFRRESETDPMVVVSANRFIPHKRIPLVISAFSKIADMPGAKLVLIGGGADEQIALAKKKAVELGIADRVVFAGVLSSDEVYEQFKNASIYLGASLEEGFPNVFIEAMHYGLPIVATDVGGSKELVVEGKTGYLVAPMDESALGRRLAELAHNRDLRNTFAAAAYERSKQFNLEVLVDTFIEMYQDLLEPKRR